MKIFKKSLQYWISKKRNVCLCLLHSIRKMSSSEIATALRPFYFSVHPDLFGQYPSEREVNENSLKLLSSFIENIRFQKPYQETTLNFYLKPRKNCSEVEHLKLIKIQLKEKNIRKTISSILSSCNLPTAYIDNLSMKENAVNGRKIIPNKFMSDRDVENESFRNIAYTTKKTNENQNLYNWLIVNRDKIQDKLRKYEPVRQEVSRLQREISKHLNLKQLVLDCGWNIRHYRGCLASFQALALHHPQEMEILNNRTVVFGRDTGISFDGYILLNSGEVRHNWLDFIKNIPKEEAVLFTLPSFEKSVSRVLRDIKVVRRKFQPKTMAKQYENNLRRLTTSLSDHQGRFGYPKHWPQSLSDYELVVETEAGPLMVSPTGQFIVPASCPSFLLINFITENLNEAKKLNQHYQSHKHIEKDLELQCLKKFELATIQKDDCITPDLMIHCCTKLLQNRQQFHNLFKDTYLYVANYYSIMLDGQICIPWNWKF